MLMDNLMWDVVIITESISKCSQSESKAAHCALQLKWVLSFLLPQLVLACMLAAWPVV